MTFFVLFTIIIGERLSGFIRSCGEKDEYGFMVESNYITIYR